MRSITVLFVEDSDDLRDAIALLLRSPQREVKACTTGEEALALYAQRDYDVLVTDVGLPGLLGTDLARKLLAEKPDRWVVLCSGYEFGPHLHRFGPNVRAIRKPFKPQELETLMNRISEAISATRP